MPTYFPGVFTYHNRSHSNHCGYHFDNRYQIVRLPLVYSEKSQYLGYLYWSVSVCRYNVSFVNDMDHGLFLFILPCCRCLQTFDPRVSPCDLAGPVVYNIGDGIFSTLPTPPVLN